MFEYLSQSGSRVITLRDTDGNLPESLGPWVRIGAADPVTYEETTIIERDGHVLREPTDA